MIETVTLKTIADRVGVSKSTVSDVLRHRISKIKVGESTKNKIFKVARDLNYEPNAAARALITGKTYNIGFLLSSVTALGLANNYFATLMSGVQDTCSQKGYNCMVSCYDMSSIENFVMPSKLKRRKVDGVVITGYVEEEVLQTLIENGLPFILIGESTDFPLEGVLSVARDMKQDWLSVFEYLYKLGHRRIIVGGARARRKFDLLVEAEDEFKQSFGAEEVTFTNYSDINPAIDPFRFAYRQAKEWLENSDGPTAVVGHDQWCVGFLSGIVDGNRKCPEDISIVSTCDTILCQWYRPAISAISWDLHGGGKAATELLINYIEKKINLIDAHRQAAKIWENRKLLVRNSSGPVRFRP